jgi:uncharacterized repeat protein (TIGR01451 family)
MKQHEGRSTRRLIVAVTLVMTLIAGGLLLKGLAEETLAVAPAALENSTKSASSETVLPGGELTYQIVLNNSSGTPVSNVVVTDTLPDDVTFILDSQTVNPSGSALAVFNAASRTITFTVPSVGSTPMTLGFRVTVADTLQPGDVITNTAMITGGGVLLQRSAMVTVEAPPTARIVAPWNNQLITQRGSFTITGRAWTDAQTPQFPDAPVLNEIVSTQSFYTVRWSAVAGADAYILQEADNPHFTDATNFPPTTTLSQLVNNKAAGTYYYRVKASDEVYGDGLWSNVVSRTVSAAAWAVAEGATEMAPVSAAPGLEINIKQSGGTDNWVPVSSVTPGLGDWWNWSYNWNLPEVDGVQYVIQVRGSDIANNEDLSVADTVTVTIQNGMTTIYLPLIMQRYPPVPYPPVLAVARTDVSANYQLSWTYPHAMFTPTSYELQESRVQDFSDNPTSQTVVSPFVRTNMAAGHYYYRVRGVNAQGRGEWSNVVHVEVAFAGFSDNFTNPATGWPRQVISIEGRQVFDMDYDNGTFRAKLMLNTQGLNNYLMGVARSPFVNPFSNYEVRAEHFFSKAPDQTVEPEWGKGGLVFAASPDYKTVFVVEWRYPDGWCAVSKYTNFDGVVVDWRWIPGNGAIRGWGPCPIVGGYDKVARARVTVNGNTASVYMNDQLIISFTDPALVGANRQGLLTGSYERTPVDSRFRNFQVAPR